MSVSFLWFTLGFLLGLVLALSLGLLMWGANPENKNKKRFDA